MTVPSEIINYIQSHETVSVPMLQKEFSLSYLVARQTITQLAAENMIAYIGGIEYRTKKYYSKPNVNKGTGEQYKRKYGIFVDWTDDDNDEADKIQIINGKILNIEETRGIVLRYCLKENKASVSIIQRRYPIGYANACKIIDWMIKERFVLAAPNNGEYKFIILDDRYQEILNEKDTDTPLSERLEDELRLTRAELDDVGRQHSEDLANDKDDFWAKLYVDDDEDEDDYSDDEDDEDYYEDEEEKSVSSFIPKDLSAEYVREDNVASFLKKYVKCDECATLESALTRTDCIIHMSIAKGFQNAFTFFRLVQEHLLKMSDREYAIYRKAMLDEDDDDD